MTLKLKYIYTSTVKDFLEGKMCRVFEISAMDLNGDGDYCFQVEDDDGTYSQDKPYLRKFLRQYDLLYKNKRGQLIARLPVEAFNYRENAQKKLFQ